MKIRNFSTRFIATIVFCFSSAADARAQTGLLLTVNDSGDSIDIVPGDRVGADSAGRCTLRATVDETNTMSDFSATLSHSNWSSSLSEGTLVHHPLYTRFFDHFDPEFEG